MYSNGKEITISMIMLILVGRRIPTTVAHGPPSSPLGSETVMSIHILYSSRFMWTIGAAPVTPLKMRRNKFIISLICSRPSGHLSVLINLNLDLAYHFSE